jgi:cation:H+ antiporter
MQYVLIIVGLLLLIIGGELLIRGAMSAANKFKVSPFLSGLVIVGFGTSMPELTVSVNAVINNNSSIALGNIIGSNIGNIGLIIGVCGLITPLTYNPLALRRDAIVMLSAVVVFVLLGLLGYFSFLAATLMLTMLAGYLAWTIFTERNTRNPSQKLHQDEGQELHSQAHKTWQVGLLIIFGLSFLIIGAQWFVSGATTIATNIGISEAFIGLTLVAVGTSLPEFTISLIAVFRKHTDVAVGNIVGSNIFNILAILGISSLISPIGLAGRFVYFDQWVLLFITVVFTLFLILGRSIGRVQSALLLTLYLLYLAFGYLYFI